MPHTPDDLEIVCAEVKKYPGKVTTNFYRGAGHGYKPLLTSDFEEALSAGKDAAMGLIRRILESASFFALFHGLAPDNYEEFVKCVREAGYGEDQVDNAELTDFYGSFVKNGVKGSLSSIIDMERVMNAAMIDEIMERIKTKGFCDTSKDPLLSFPGPPTY